MKKLLLFLLITIGFSLQHSLMANEPDSAYVFAYATDKNAGRNGLHFAWSTDRNTWHSIGPERTFLRSEYASGRHGKRMLSPYLIKGNDGMWHCLWSVHEGYAVFAHCVSTDLISWGQQAFPTTGNTGNCMNPSVTFSPTGQDYLITWNSLQGENTKTYSCRTKDFRTYSIPQAENVAVPHRQQVTINGITESGTLHRVAWNEVEALIQTDKMAKYKAIQNAERLAINPELFKDTITLNVTLRPEESKKISDMLIGVFFEDINYGADGGLYAELVQNRDFEYSPNDIGREENWTATNSWSPGGEGLSFDIDTVAPLHAHNPHYAVLDIKEKGHGLVNDGFDGIPVREGEKYDLSVFAKQLEGKGGKIRVSLVQDGRVVAQTTLKAPKSDWKKMTAVLKADADADHASIKVEPLGTGKVALDMISLFPQQTFKGRKNGLRADLAQTLADLKPKFMRFPGGCVAHGDGLHNIYNWKETIGTLEARKPQRNLWGYHQTKGLGYYEYFQFCEDMGCEPLPVLAAGVSCQNSSDRGHGQQGGIPMDKMPEYVQDVLDLIEWANGDAKTTKWGKLRAEQGHPAPFNLKYIGIGNEDLISKTFEERYLMIVKAVKEKYPDIVVCGTSGPWSEGSDYETGWRLAKDHKIDMIDEHYYQTPGWFIYHQDYYDQYDRNGSKVYLGEYAAHTPGRPNNIETALCEALHICGMERNGDVVAMSSYAPLLAKEHHTQWNPDMIYFNNKEVKPTVGYYVQKLCGNYCGDEYIESTLSVNEGRKGVRERLAVSTVRDSKTGKVYIKMVNLLNHPVKGKLDLSSLKDRFGEAQSLDARLHVLTGNWDDRNARPKESDIKVKPEFDYELPAYSFSLIEI